MRRCTVALALLVALPACEKRFSLGALRPVDVSTGGGHGKDGGAVVGDDGGVEACGPARTPLDLGDGLGMVCADGPRQGFRFGVCTCEDLQSSGAISVDAFDSEQGGYTGEISGSLGVNGAFYPGAAVVGGSVWVAGSNGIPLGASVFVGGNLFDQGQLDGPHQVRVDGAAHVGGSINVRTLTVGSLTVNASSQVAVTDGAPEASIGEVDVAPPCDCEPKLDIPAMVAAAAGDNDNERIGLDPAEGMRALSEDLELTLPCGRYYVDAFYAARPITLTITGPVELYVRGSIVADAAGTVGIQFTSGGELDLFVERGFSVANRFDLGRINAPGRARIYAGGGETLFFGGHTVIAGSVYAPEARLVSSGPFELFGAMLLLEVSASAPLSVHYDRALARDDCAAAACETSDDCGVLACKGDACAACTRASDCADGLRCDRGLCLP